MKKNISSKIIIPFIIIVLLVIFIIYNFFNRDNGYNKYKERSSEDIVYTIFNSGDTYIPYINLDCDVATEINKIIVDRGNAFLGENEDNVITYTYDLSGKILSLAIQYISMSEDYPTITYDVYNIHVSNYRLLDNNEILNLYSINEKQVYDVVESKFKSFYVDLYNKKYFDEECNYDCFLYMRGIENTNYLEDSSYYIKNGNLYVIKPFKIYSVFEEEKYFSSSDFLIQITE